MRIVILHKEFISEFPFEFFGKIYSPLVPFFPIGNIVISPVSFKFCDPLSKLFLKFFGNTEFFRKSTDSIGKAWPN